MSVPDEQYQIEIQRNLETWRRKPLLRRVYDGFHDRIIDVMDPSVPGAVVELGSGVGQLKARLPHAILTDLFPNSWIDLVCTGYQLPFASGRVSHIILFDVFHHLRQPAAFLREARRVMAPGGRVIIMDPYISLASFPVYAWLHPEPVAWRQPIDLSESAAPDRQYYASQGNATRLFFRREAGTWPDGWRCLHASATSEFSYLLTGGFSRGSWYPERHLDAWRRLDARLSRWPRLFAARCLVALTPS